MTVSELQRRIAWPLVEEKQEPEYGLIYLNIRPKQSGDEPIYFCMNDDRSCLQQFGFGTWHCHPDESDQAVDMARWLVEGKRCIVKEIDQIGKCSGSALLGPKESPKTLSRNTKSLHRVFFDRELIYEEIDFTSYFDGKHGWISHDHKAYLEQQYKDLGLALPEL